MSPRGKRVGILVFAAPFGTTGIVLGSPPAMRGKLLRSHLAALFRGITVPRKRLDEGSRWRADEIHVLQHLTAVQPCCGNFLTQPNGCRNPASKLGLSANETSHQGTHLSLQSDTL